MTINKQDRRGFVRLWLVLSACWLLAGIYPVLWRPISLSMERCQPSMRFISGTCQLPLPSMWSRWQQDDAKVELARAGCAIRECDWPNDLISDPTVSQGSSLGGHFYEPNGIALLSVFLRILVWIGPTIALPLVLLMGARAVNWVRAGFGPEP